jgi:hypothetical protein
MINLKLGEYKNKKFKRFLEIGKDFVFGGEVIGFTSENHDEQSFDKYPDLIQWFEKDKKDPLNRFNGLFDNRTYGEGKFVLIINDEDDIYQCYDVYERWHRRKGDVNSSELTDYDNEGYSDEDYRICENQGNLHEKPELYQKIKNI